MHRKKDKDVKAHRQVNASGLDGWNSHERIAKYGYCELADYAIDVLAYMRWVAQAQRDAKSQHPAAIAEYERRAVIVGRWVADCLNHPGAAEILRAVAVALDYGERRNLTVLERPGMVIPIEEFNSTFNDADGPKPVKHIDLIRNLEARGLSIPKLPIPIKPADPIRLKLAFFVRETLRENPEHRLSMKDIPAWF